MENAEAGIGDQRCGFAGCRQPAVRSLIVGLRMEGHWAIEGSWVRRRVFLCEEHREVLDAQTGAFSFRSVPAAGVKGDGAATAGAAAEGPARAGLDGELRRLVPEETTEQAQQDHA